MQLHEFLEQVQERAKLPSAEAALRATRATLSTLGQRLQGHEPANLAAQLPRELQPFLQGAGSGGGERFSTTEFFRRVSDKEGIDLPTSVFHARMVMEVLKEAVSLGELEELRAQLPSEWRRLFEEDQAWPP